eukprot:TRINITY_DN4470_c0_g1_i1.p1 TRINITY_DN4470_c0_g1~~TRINITY_DN4470_c0_g1_i1.p1  ORF type:complete len:223 (-),score=30.92 TRINITY_DN4470_c0_g1_i1:8-676(-)
MGWRDLRVLYSMGIRWTMHSYLISGEMVNGSVVVYGESVREIDQPNNFRNKGHESLTLVDGGVMAIYEWNEFGDSDTISFAVLFKEGREPMHIPFPSLSYRLTDSTEVDENNNFWMINFRYPWKDAPLSPRYKYTSHLSDTHLQYPQIESLIHLHYDNTTQTITTLPTPPIYLQLTSKIRNWEGLAKLSTQHHSGFLLATDKFPSTILSYIELPDKEIKKLN